MYARILILHLYVRRTTATFAAITALSAFLYGIFLLIAVDRAASYDQAQGQLQSLSTELSSLQAKYLSDTQTLTPQLAAQLGFVVVPMGAEAFANTSSGALSLQHAGPN